MQSLYPLANVSIESAPRRYARLGGALYLVLILLGARAELIRDSLLSSNPAVTAANLLSHPVLWRTGIVAEFMALVSVTALTMIYYVLFRPVSREITLLATFLRLIAIAVQAVVLMNLFAALFPLTTGAATVAFTPAQLQALTALAIKSHAYGYGLALLFFGFCFLPHGYLIVRSGFLPKTLGILIAVAGLCYLANSYALFLAPAIEERIFPAILLPSFIGELSLCLWLLVKGVDEEKWLAINARAAAPAR